MHAITPEKPGNLKPFSSPRSLVAALLGMTVVVRAMRFWLFNCFTLLTLLFPAMCPAQIETSFPLEGRYREGKYMPVRVSTAAAGTVTLAADGAVPAELPFAAKSDVIVPLLSVRTLANLRWSQAGGAPVPISTPLKPLLDADRLIAFVGEEAGRTRDAAMLFPGQQIVSVRIDTARPGRILEPAVAYESLDGVLLDASAATRIDESQLAVFLAAGTVVAVRSGEDQKPGGGWPWKREGAYWVLRHDIAGPAGVMEPEAYKPTYPWVRGWPGAFRRQAVLIVAVFGITAVALLLWRSRYAIVALIVISLGTAGGVVAWGAHQNPILIAGGNITVSDGQLTQQDNWSFRTTLRPADVSFRFQDLCRPVLDSRSQLEKSQIKLITTPEGQPDRYVAKLEADNALAVLSRIVRPGKPKGSATEPVTSPLGIMANQLYPGKVIGQSSGGETVPERSWGEIRLENWGP